ncbi:MAG: hypothetical protein M3019_11005 [Candidatus Dormibacteraeota bacterium]|nr:hypothetical protein [Candidatus Dormibacteraeota bacterium]
MNALINEESVDVAEQPEAVRNIVARCQDIEEHFPGDLTEEALPYFIDWLI